MVTHQPRRTPRSDGRTASKGRSDEAQTPLSGGAVAEVSAKVWEAAYLPFGGVDVTSGTPMDLRFPRLVVPI